MSNLREQYEGFFRDADVDGSGELTKDEIRAALSQAYYSETQLEEIFSAIDASEDKKISLDEYITLMESVADVQHSKAALRRVFKAFDTDGSGKLGVSEVREAIGSSAANLPDEQIQRLVDSLDTDGDQLVDCDEFIERL